LTCLGCRTQWTASYQHFHQTNKRRSNLLHHHRQATLEVKRISVLKSCTRTLGDLPESMRPRCTIPSMHRDLMGRKLRKLQYRRKDQSFREFRPELIRIRDLNVLCRGSMLIRRVRCCLATPLLIAR
jgi:hypothetical protein